MIIYYDSYSESGIHERVNHSLTRFIIKKNKEIIFFSDKHYMKFGAVNFKGVNFNRKNKIIKFINRDIINPLLLLFFTLTNARKIDKIIISGFSKHQIVFLYFLSFLHKNISYLFHSQLEIFDQEFPKGKSFIKKINIKINFYFYRKIIENKMIKKLVLGEHIIENLKSFLKCNSIFSTPHPYTALDYISFKKSGHKKLIENFTKKNRVYGVIGLLRDDTKNSSSIYNIAINNPDCKFEIVGRIGPDFKLNNSITNINHTIFEKLVSEEILYNSARNITDLIFDFPKSKYRFTSSGSVLDAIILGCGIVINKNHALLDATSDLKIKTVTDEFKNLSTVKNNELINLDLISKNYSNFIKKRVWHLNNSNLINLVNWLE